MNALQGQLTSANLAGDSTDLTLGTGSVIEACFGIELETTLKCQESDLEAEVVQKSMVYSLECNIRGGGGEDLKIDHLAQVRV